MASQELKINLTVNEDGTAVIKNFSNQASANLKKVEDAVSSMGGGFAKTWQGMAVGLNQGIQLFQQLVGAIQAPIEAYMQSETALLKMGMAMKNQGDFSRAALADMEDFAAQLQKTTAYEDDATLAIMGNLKSYGLSNEQIKQATKAALDLATAKANEGMTIEKASEIMGKSYLGISTGLKKLGIQVDETTDKSELFNVVMKQVEDRFGGSAQAELLTYSGQWKQLKNQWGDIQEFLGLVFLKTIEAIMFSFSMMGAGFWTVTETMLKSLGWLTEKLGEFANFIGLEKVSKGIGVITDSLKAGATNAREASAAAVQNADSNYKNMMSFDKVSTAIDKMGKSGQRTMAIDEDAAKAAKKLAQEREQATKAITEAIRKSSIEIDGYSKSQYEKDLIRIESEKKEWKEKGVETVKITQWETAEILKAEQKLNDETTKLAQEDYDNWRKLEKEKTALEQKNAADKLSAERDIYKDLRGYEVEAHAGTILLISDQAKKYRQLKIDNVAVDAWETEEYRKANLKKAELAGDFYTFLKLSREQAAQQEKNLGTLSIQTYKDINAAKTTVIDAGVTAFIKGEDAKVAVQQAAGDAIVRITGKYATAAFDIAIEKTISLVGAYIGQGAASSGANAASGGAMAAVGEIGVYLGAAVAAMLGGKALASQFRAEGGWIGTHPNGGFINQGSGYKDDVYLGRTENTRHWGMGGEFVVNKKASQEHQALLVALNSGRFNYISDTGFSAGGYTGSKGQELVGNPDDLALKMAVGGELVFAKAFGEALQSGTDIYGAIAAGIVQDIVYIVSACGGALGGKALANSFKADGGTIRDMGHFSFGDLIPGPIRDIVDPIKDILPYIIPGIPIPGENPLIPVIKIPGLPSLDPAKIPEDANDYFDEAWKGFLDTQRIGWRNFAEAVLVPGTTADFDPMNGIVNELTHFGESIVTSMKLVFKPPGVRMPWEEDWAKGGMIIDPVFARNGLDYVPRDNFPATLHKGEAVLNEKAADKWRSGDSDELLYQLVKSNSKILKIIDRWESFIETDGLPVQVMS